MVLGSPGWGRLDHSLYSLSLLYKWRRCYNTVKVYLWDSYGQTMLLSPGINRIHFALEGRKFHCGLIPLAGKGVIVSSSGLQWDLDQIELDFSTATISACNVVQLPTVQVKTSDLVLFTVSYESTTINDG